MVMKIGGCLLVLALLAGSARAQGPDGKAFGLGLSLGEPAGVNAKYWFDHKNAVDMAVGYGFYPSHGVAFFADYLYNVFTIIRAGKTPFDLLFYMGAGVKLGVWRYRQKDEDTTGVGLGVRVPFGVTMVFARAPFDIFLEITPSMAFIAPDPFYFDLDACIGGRFYF
ncbi:MAG TPA: DUF3996 domain-containing protein [Myxococcota bacterium]|nr:DUF3996 domain-containing protein [Myxococcota bacterium]